MQGTALALLFLCSSNWRSEKWSKGKGENPMIVSLEQHPDHILFPAVLYPGFSSCCEPSKSLQPQTTPVNGIEEGLTSQLYLFALSPVLCPRILEGMSTSGLGEALRAASCSPTSLGLIQQLGCLVLVIMHCSWVVVWERLGRGGGEDGKRCSRQGRASEAM